MCSHSLMCSVFFFIYVLKPSELVGLGLKLSADYFLDFKTFGLEMKDFYL